MKNDLEDFKIAIFKPNKNNYSETFIENQINFLKVKKEVLFGGYFPTSYGSGKFLINNPFSLALYWIQKNIFKKEEISIRNHYLSKFLKREKINLVLANYGVSGALVWKSCSQIPIPLVIHFHGFDAHDISTLEKYKSRYQEAFNYCSSIIVVSLVMRDSLLKIGAPSSKITYIPYGVDLKFFPKVDPIHSDLIFLSVARFAEKKSPDSTIKAFSIVLKSFPEALLIMAGIGPLWDSCRNLAKELGIENQIKFLGIQSPNQVKALMKNSRAFVQHSIMAPGGDMEGTPNSILEASGSGLPIVSTFHAGIPEAVIHEETGFLVKEGDIDLMASYMLELAKNPSLAQKMGERGRIHIEKEYCLEKQIQKLESVLLTSFKNFNLIPSS